MKVVMIYLMMKLCKRMTAAIKSHFSFFYQMFLIKHPQMEAKMKKKMPIKTQFYQTQRFPKHSTKKHLQMEMRNHMKTTIRKKIHKIKIKLEVL